MPAADGALKGYHLLTRGFDFDDGNYDTFVSDVHDLRAVETDDGWEWSTISSRGRTYEQPQTEGELIAWLDAKTSGGVVL